MLTITICACLFALGIGAIVLWGGASIAPLPNDAARPAIRMVRLIVIALVAGWGAGICIAGAGGRIVMRILAATSGDDALGARTEADEIIGVISLSGTVEFIAFAAIFEGVMSALLFVLVYRGLPQGRLLGLSFGVVLLVVASTVVEPLRPDNIDFGLVSPTWLAVLLFAVLVMLHGMAIAAIAGRYSHVIGAPARTRKGSLPYVPAVLVVNPIALPFTVVSVAVVEAWTWLARRVPSLRVSDQLVRRATAGAVIVACVAALPNFVVSMRDLLS